jgi:hypothetical protein
VDGPIPTVTGVKAASTGTNIICTCDGIADCQKPSADVLTISGTGFAPLPVSVLTEAPTLELPTVILRGPGTQTQEIFIYGDRDNELGVTLKWAKDTELQVTLTPEFVKAKFGTPQDAGRYAVVVLNPNGERGELEGGLEVVLGPKVLKVAPEFICPTIDQPVTVSGENFRPGAQVALIGGGTTYPIAPADTTFDAQTKDLKIVVRTGKVPVGDYDVQVILAEGCSHTLKNALHMVAPPDLESIEPAVICDQLDTKVTLTGKDFRNGATVSIGDQAVAAADVTFVSATTIEVVVRKGLADGAYDVTVKNPEGCSSTSPTKLTVVPPPTLSSVAPTPVCTGGKVTLTGTGFRANPTVTLTPPAPGTPIPLSGTPLVTVTSDKTIDVLLSSLSPGVYDVQVTNQDGCSSTTLKGVLTVTPGPSIVAVDPSTVYSKANFPVAIFGSGFQQGATVTIGGTATTAPVIITDGVVSPTGDRIDIIVPAGLPPGTYDLSITSGGCTAFFTGKLTVTDQLTVSVCGIDPPFGYTGEKTAVTITTGTCCASCNQKFVSTPRAWLDVNGTLKALRSVAFVTADSLTGAVEAGLAPSATPYDLLVQNPDGQIGLLTKAFRVVDQPVPFIQAINPSSVDTQFNGTLTITGKNFRAPATVEIISSTGTKTALSGPTVGGTPVGTQVTAGLNATIMLVGAYVVRVTNTDQQTYSDFSALAVTNPAGNLSPWSPLVAGTEMTTARRRHAMVAGRVSSAARFLYAIGGDSGSSTLPLDSVEIVPLDKFGNVGTWAIQRYTLKTARRGHGAVVQGRYLYVLGGETASTPLKSVERALILDPAGAPEVTTFTFTLGGSLGKGAWYYRVSATMPATDQANPGGETLPSDPVIVQAIQGVRVTLTWKPIPGVASYNIYRTPTAGGAFGGEQLLDEGLVPTTVCTATACTYEDQGTGTIKNPNQKPLPIGATGVFVDQGVPALGVERSGAAVTLARDPAGQLYVYAAGGRSNATTVLDTLELATLSADGATLGSFVTATSKLDSPRERLMLVVGEHGTSPKIPATTVYLYEAGGISGTTVKSTGYSSSVPNGGQPGAFSVVSALKNLPLAAAGYMVNDTFYFFGGSSDGTNALAASNSCELTAPPAFKNCNSLGPAIMPSARMNAGLALESAYFYLSGGGPNDQTATKDVIKTIY